MQYHKHNFAIQALLKHIRCVQEFLLCNYKKYMNMSKLFFLYKHTFSLKQITISSSNDYSPSAFSWSKYFAIGHETRIHKSFNYKTTTQLYSTLPAFHTQFHTQFHWQLLNLIRFGIRIFNLFCSRGSIRMVYWCTYTTNAGWGRPCIIVGVGTDDMLRGGGGVSYPQ